MFAHLYIPSCFILQLVIIMLGRHWNPPNPSPSLNLLEILKKYILELSQGANEHFVTISLPSFLLAVTFS